MSRDGRYNSQVKARVFVSLKRTVLDPQGQTVRSALTGLGYQSVSDVRQVSSSTSLSRQGSAANRPTTRWTRWRAMF